MKKMTKLEDKLKPIIKEAFKIEGAGSYIFQRFDGDLIGDDRFYSSRILLRAYGNSLVWEVKLDMNNPEIILYCIPHKLLPSQWSQLTSEVVAGQLSEFKKSNRIVKLYSIDESLVEKILESITGKYERYEKRDSLESFEFELDGKKYEISTRIMACRKYVYFKQDGVYSKNPENDIVEFLYKCGIDPHMKIGRIIDKDFNF